MQSCAFLQNYTNKKTRFSNFSLFLSDSNSFFRPKSIILCMETFDALLDVREDFLIGGAEEGLVAEVA